jgi:two-component system alkaline phosphatase synthesis response regulator PhoP
MVGKPAHHRLCFSYFYPCIRHVFIILKKQGFLIRTSNIYLVIFSAKVVCVLKKNIFVLEDDLISLKLIKSSLEKYNYCMLEATNAASAEEILTNSRFAAAILDLNLPDINGLDVLKKLRNHPIHGLVPVIILTANNDKTDTVLALELGADDYMTKPFNGRELVARIDARLRRISQHQEAPAANTLILGNLVIDTAQREVSVNQVPVRLTYNEYELLLLLALNVGIVLSRDFLLNKLWGYDFIAETRTVDIHISSLRKKLGSADSTLQYIETVRGVGYRFIPPTKLIS